MKNIILDNEEKEILKDLETGNFKKVKYDFSVFKKEEVKIQIDKKDLETGRLIAKQDGKTYEELLSIIAHKIAIGEIRI